MRKKYKIGMYISLVLTIVALLIVLASIVDTEIEGPPEASEAQMQMETPENEISGLTAEGEPERGKLVIYLEAVAYLGMIALAAYYAIKGYKKPHGNLLRWTMLAFSAAQILLLGGKISRGLESAVYIQSFVILCTAYMAGRLNKIEKNKYIAVLILALLIYIAVVVDIGLAKISIIKMLSAFTPVVIWIDICYAYFIRYTEHKEAGLEDAPKN